MYIQESWRFLGVHEASLLGQEVLVLVLPEISFPYSAAFSISTITSSSEVQIMQTLTLNCRTRRDLQLWYSNFLHLTSLMSPNWAHKVLLSWNPRISRDLIEGWIGLLINLPCLHILHTQAILSLRNLLHNGLGPSLWVLIVLLLLIISPPWTCSINPLFEKSSKLSQLYLFSCKN